MRTLLLVEDDASLRAAISEGLAAHGFRVEQVGTIREARERLEEGRFDVVVSDIRLPDSDGETLERAFDAQPQTPVVLITGYDDVEPSVQGLRRRAVALLMKPVTLARLRASVNRAIDLRDTHH